MAVLFVALLAGLAYALTARRPLSLPARAFTVGQALLGVTIGAVFDPVALGSLGGDWVPVLLVSAATLGLSVLAGFALRLDPEISAATGTFAMIAGGASGIVAISRELGADDRVVAVVQYLRVLVILVAMPVVARVVFHPGSGEPARTVAPAPVAGWVPAWIGGLPGQVILVAICVAAGLSVERRVDIPAGALLWPLGVAVLLALAGLPVIMPGWLEAIGYALIGLQVGLRFTRASLRAVAALLPLALAVIAGLMVASALLGLLLARLTGVTALDGYLATTPGGLYAVLATAVDSGSDVTFVLTVQVVRLFVMLLGAPLLAQRLRTD